MTVRQAVGLILSLLVAAPLGRAAGQGQVIQKCELRPGHQLVNSGVLSLKSANDTKFEDQRQKDLKDAYRVLTQAVTTGRQEKNPAAWYYLARYYAVQKDLEGADSAFAKAQELAPKCKDEIELWRRSLWVPRLRRARSAMCRHSRRARRSRMPSSENTTSARGGRWRSASARRSTVAIRTSPFTAATADASGPRRPSDGFNPEIVARGGKRRRA